MLERVGEDSPLRDTFPTVRAAVVGVHAAT
jgi:hypothetical protein